VSAGLGRRSFRKELEKRLGSSIAEFFAAYGRAVEVWARGTLDNLAREFETQADVYRAQLRRFTQTVASETAVPHERVLEDISLLRQELDLDVVGDHVESGAVVS
jgi:hypothetical protein